MLLRGFGDDNPVGGCAQRRYLRASCMNACESRHACVLPPMRLLGLMVCHLWPCHRLQYIKTHRRPVRALALLSNSTLRDDDGNDRKVPGAVLSL